MGFAHFVPAAPVATPPGAAELYVRRHLTSLIRSKDTATECHPTPILP